MVLVSVLCAKLSKAHYPLLSPHATGDGELADETLVTMNLTQYELVNLLALLTAAYRATWENPLCRLNTGDWLGMLQAKCWSGANKYASEKLPNLSSEKMLQAVSAYVAAAVQEAIQPYRDQYEWIAANLCGIYVDGAAVVYHGRRYARLDELAMAEISRELSRSLVSEELHRDANDV